MIQSLKSKAVIDDRYEIIELLGAGGMGVVYKARHLEFDRIVALKFLQSHLGEDTETLARFKLEATILSSLNHRNILHFYSFGVWHARAPYIAMEFIDAPDLAGVLAKEDGHLTWRRTLLIAQQICEGLAHAHKHGVIHRDLKPSNVFVISENGTERVKISDFGLAKVVDEETRQKLTATGLTLGSPHYMSPEQAEGRPITAAADVYALGCVIYQCLFANPPFDSDTIGGVLFQKVHTDLLLPDKALGKSLPKGLLDVLRTSMEKDPQKRFRTMEDMSAAIAEVLAGAADWKDCKSKFRPRGHAIESVSSGGANLKQRQLVVAGTVTLLAVVAACCLVFAFSRESTKLSQLDSAHTAARDRGDFLGAANVELQRLALCPKGGGDDFRQAAYSNLSKDFDGAVRSSTFHSLPLDARRKFVESVCYALAQIDPALLTRTEVERFFEASGPTCQSVEDDDLRRFYSAAVMHLWKGHERNEETFLAKAVNPGRDLVLLPRNSRYLDEIRRLHCQTLGLQKIQMTDDEADNASRSACREVHEGRIDDSVRTALPIYLSYCLGQQSERCAKALDQYCVALDGATKDNRSHFVNEILFNFDDVLASYHSRIGDDAAVAFLKRAVDNAGLITANNLLQFEATWRARYAEALVSRGRFAEAAQEYERAAEQELKSKTHRVELARCYQIEQARLLGRLGDAKSKARSVALYRTILAAERADFAGLALHKSMARIGANASHLSPHPTVQAVKSAAAEGRTSDPAVLRLLCLRKLSSGDASDREEAGKLATRALSTDDGCLEVDRALIAMSKQDYVQADFWMRRFLNYWPEVHSASYAANLSILAKLRMLRGEKAEAERIASLAVYYWDNAIRLSIIDAASQEYQEMVRLAHADAHR